MTTTETNDDGEQESIGNRAQDVGTEIYYTGIDSRGSALAGSKYAGINLDDGHTQTLIDALEDEVLVDVTRYAADAEVGVLAMISPDQADDLADALRQAAADVREYTEAEK